MKYINIHTHKPQQPNEKAIQNLYQQFEQVNEPGNYSLGLHPWHINNYWKNEFEKLKHFAKHENVLAIGECGLDKACSTSFELQKQVFGLHIDLANRCQKPLIIHCVKAFDVILHELKKATVPVVFHGFVKGKELAKQIIRAGHYLSFGKALQKPGIQQVLAELPLENIFLETDDADLGIAEVYQLAAKALVIEEDFLSLQLEKNALNVFKLKA